MPKEVSIKVWELQDLHGDLAGILTIALGKRKPLSEDDEVCKEVLLVVGGHNQSDKMVAGKRSTLDCNDADKMVAGERYHLDCKGKKTGKDKMVAGAGFEPATFGL